MIRPNELRKGNYILFNGEVDTISGIGEANNGFCFKGGYFNFDDDLRVFPIPLTPEILEKIPIVEPYLELKQRSKDGSEYWIDLGFVKYVKYLHEYQNLFFALTGEELEITLNS